MSDRSHTFDALERAPAGTCHVGPGHESAVQAAAVAAAEAIAVAAAAEVAAEAAATARVAVQTASAAAAKAAARARHVAAAAVSAATAAAAEATLHNDGAARSDADAAAAAASSDLFGTDSDDLPAASDDVGTRHTASQAAAATAAKAADTVAAAVAAVATAAAQAVLDAAALIESQLGRDVAAAADAVDRATAVTSAQTRRPTNSGGTRRTRLMPAVEAAEQAVLERLLAERAVRTVFQPLVGLDSGQVLGYEALSRGPAGTALERPDLLFAAARRGRRLRDLDIACRAAALMAAKAAGLTDPYRLFINAEPEALDGWRPSPEHEHLPLTVVLELTERALTGQPAQLLQTVARVRALGWGVALDDVGADPASLALLPLVQPDVIKLDLALIQGRPSAHIVAVVNAVNAEAERSGTIVLAEGIETEEHLRTARAFGATVGQGWYFGRPGPLPSPLPAFAAAAPLPVVPRRAGTDDPSPFHLAAVDRPVRSADKRLLIEISKQLEAQAYAAGGSAIVLAAFQDASFFTPATRRRYAGLVRSCAFVAALGRGMPAEPLPGVRGAVIGPGDPLLGEWDIAVLGPHFAACLVARDLGDGGPDMDRRFEFILSHDRELTIRVAASLMSRVWPETRTTDLPQLPLPRGLLLPETEPYIALAIAAGPPRSALPAVVSDRPPRELAALSNGLLERALDASTTGITIADMSRPDAPLIWVNAAFSELTGYADYQVLGRNCRVLQGPATDTRTVAELGAAVAAGRQVHTRLMNYRADGMPWWNELQLSPVRDDRGALTHYIGVQHDVTARVEAEAKVLHLACHDALTGLPNRERLSAALTDSLDRGRRTGTATALLFLDLVEFKAINDAHGHDVGDQLLCQVAGRLRLGLRADDLLARQGGDEFLLLLADLPTPLAAGIAERVAEDLLAALRPPFLVARDRKVQVGASIGISLAPADAAPDQLLRQADAAMYTAKRTTGSFWSRHPTGS